jgi:protoheme IX farnesyltransferase
MSSLNSEPYLAPAKPVMAGADNPAAARLAVAPADVLVPKTSLLKTLVVLFKLRIVGLLVFAAIGGAFIGAGGWPGTGRLALLVVTGGLAAAGASALNEYLERESDARMVRTQKRPLVSGALAHPGWVPYVAGLMILLPALAVLPFNPPLTLFLLLGAFIYVGVYTVWLKPRTPLNIVLGGAAGSAAVLSGSAAAGHWNETGALVLAMLLFLWTPSHFWSLAIVYRNDYARGGIPMLPVTVGPRQSAAWVFLHTGATALAALMLAAHPALGWLYFIPVAGATVDLMLRNARLLAEPTGKRAWSLFKASNLYLALILLMICVDTVV